jgi:hypothetical protein
MDGATEDFLIALFERMRDRPLMALITTRPKQRRGWADGAGASEMTLDPYPGRCETAHRQQLSRPQAAAAVFDEIRPRPTACRCSSKS